MILYSYDEVGVIISHGLHRKVGKSVPGSQGWKAGHKARLETRPHSFAAQHPLVS